MTVYPSIDVMSGRVVRLAGGDPSRATAYAPGPLEAARMWAGEGAGWVHLVSLDAAFGVSGIPEDLVRDISSIGIRVQYGGGVRSADDARRVIAAGASRIVLGTAAVADPELPAALAGELGAEMVAVALDTRGGRIAVSGWRARSREEPVNLGRRLAAGGVRHALLTVVERDGAMCGPAVRTTASLAEATGLEVIASGGVSSLRDVAALAGTGLVSGVIVGRALYEGAVSLADVLREAGGGGDPC